LGILCELCEEDDADTDANESMESAVAIAGGLVLDVVPVELPVFALRLLWPELFKYKNSGVESESSVLSYMAAADRVGAELNLGRFPSELLSSMNNGEVSSSTIMGNPGCSIVVALLLTRLFDCCCIIVQDIGFFCRGHF